MRTRVGLFLYVVIQLIEDVPVKRPTSFSEQLDIMRSRGLYISDHKNSLAILERINYYRLSAYTLTIKNRQTDIFFEGTKFEDIYGLYEFDRKIRHLLVGILESIEIAFRTCVAYDLAHAFGSLGYMQGENFVDESFHANLLSELEKSKSKNQEVFIDHHNKKYGGQFPIWVAVELMSFGTISKLYSNLQDGEKQRIAKKYYGTSPAYLTTWIHTAVYIRNICAHYGRLYNKSLKVSPKLHKRNKKLRLNKSLFSAIFVFRELCRSTDEWNNFVTNLDAIIDQYSCVIDLPKIGFPTEWEKALRQQMNC